MEKSFSPEEIRKKEEQEKTEESLGQDKLHEIAKETNTEIDSQISDGLAKNINKHAEYISDLKVEKAEAEVTDGLTGIKNKKALLEKIAPGILDIERRDSQVSVLMIDIDRFKKYNDTLGHPAGDEILKKLPSIIGRAIRKSDQLFRYGGEEFTVLLPEANSAKAMEIAERIRKEVEQEVMNLKSVPEESKEQKITLSIGIYSSEQLPEDYWEDYKRNRSDDVLKLMIAKADKALYQAKKGGRNQSVLFHESMENIKNNK